MTIRKLQPAQWASYFDQVSKGLPASKVDILLSGADLGVQMQTRESPLIGITYDASDRAVYVSTEQLEHRIDAPEHIYVDEEQGALRAIEAIDQQGNKQIVEFRRALQLTAPR